MISKKALEQDFDYRDYVNVVVHDDGFPTNPEDKALEQNMVKQIENILQQMAQTPEGQDVLRKARETNGGRRIVLDVSSDPSPKENDNHADPETNTVYIRPAQLYNARYLGTDGQMHNMSLNRIVFHEIAHIPNKETAEEATLYRQQYNQILLNAVNEATGLGFETAEEAEKYYKEIPDEETELIMKIALTLEESLQKVDKPWEQRVADITSVYMQKYHGEVPRIYMNSDEEGTFGVEVYEDLGQTVPETRNPFDLSQPM